MLKLEISLYVTDFGGILLFFLIRVTEKTVIVIKPRRSLATTFVEQVRISNVLII